VTKNVFENLDGSNLSEFFERCDGIVLSQGAGTPNKQPSLSHRAISDNPNKLLLGVCLSHQPIWSQDPSRTEANFSRSLDCAIARGGE
jgi:anthranilate/para-aminobenzoate synthase component II